MRRRGYPLVGLVGWGVTFGAVIGYDTWAHFAHRPTMSATLGHYLAHPILGPVLAGAWAGLTYHLLIEELWPAFQSEHPGSSDHP